MADLGAPDDGAQISPASVIEVGSMLSRRTEVVACGWEPEADSPSAEFCVWACSLSNSPSSEPAAASCRNLCRQCFTALRGLEAPRVHESKIRSAIAARRVCLAAYGD